MSEATVLTRYALLTVFVNVLLDQAGLPIPAVPVLVACGALAARGEISLTLLLLVAALASLTGDLAWYALGRWRGRRVLKTFCRLSLHPDKTLTKMELSVRHHGLVSIAVAKFIPGLALVAPPLAGALGLSVSRFALVSFLTGLAWAGAVVAIGWLFEGAVNEATQWIEALGVWGLVLVALLLSSYVAFLWWRRRRARLALERDRDRSGGGRKDVTGRPQCPDQGPEPAKRPHDGMTFCAEA